MHKIATFAVWKNALLMAAFVLMEVSGIGPIAKYRTGECYDLFEQTGHPVFWLVVYTLFFIVWPLFDLLAIILKPRITVNNFGIGER